MDDAAWEVIARDLKANNAGGASLSMSLVIWSKPPRQKMRTIRLRGCF